MTNSNVLLSSGSGVVDLLSGLEISELTTLNLFTDPDQLRFQIYIQVKKTHQAFGSMLCVCLYWYLLLRRFWLSIVWVGSAAHAVPLLADHHSIKPSWNSALSVIGGP